MQASKQDRPGSKDASEKGLWSSMLDSVASGKKLPEKNLIVLGGTPDTQKEFLDTLDSESPKRPQVKNKKKPIVANDFALGYTYQNVLDADHEVILLDWNTPWSWVQQLRDWVVLLRSVTASLSDQSKEALEEAMRDWQEKRRNVSSYEAGGSTASSDANVTIPLSQGEWDEPLGLPACVVCQHSERINTLEIEQNWHDEDFDFILQCLRTILMKHGSSLIYISSAFPNSLPTLIHSSLGIHSMLKKQALKHNVIDREKILIPPNWDSWGKIRVIREGFDVEGVSSKWSQDITSNLGAASGNENESPERSWSAPKGPVVSLYESTISGPYASKREEANKKPGIEISVPNMQTFLASQQEVLARLAAEDERSAATSATSSTFSMNTSSTSASTHDRMADQIGPVQVNMGGIQVDADDVVRKLQTQSKRDVSASSSKDGDSTTPKGKGEGATMSTPDMKAENERMQLFFSNLMKRGWGLSDSLVIANSLQQT
ncbi:uncharacterized protein KY384_000489 [Bacidia gigantensis]|uniref:uncharacterized protein n=1 Tax=Bacidia gigantensis TaxID=2732470 RepID=UPI001D052572|nr:uncharacterized protein KY384_000489 [Bacidia gigantensis]KAG8525729.1 hypothetical protein KY384_000489 [Bacidia gigantensis]